MPKRVRLRHRRLASELAKSRRSQNFWALKLDISPAYLSQMRNGRRIYPGPEIQRKLIRGLGIPFDELFAVDSVSDESRAGPVEQLRPLLHWEVRTSIRNLE